MGEKVLSFKWNRMNKDGNIFSTVWFNITWCAMKWTNQHTKRNKKKRTIRREIWEIFSFILNDMNMGFFYTSNELMWLCRFFYENTIENASQTQCHESVEFICLFNSKSRGTIIIVLRIESTHSKWLLTNFIHEIIIFFSSPSSINTDIAHTVTHVSLFVLWLIIMKTNRSH